MPSSLKEGKLPSILHFLIHCECGEVAKKQENGVLTCNSIPPRCSFYLASSHSGDTCGRNNASLPKEVLRKRRRDDDFAASRLVSRRSRSIVQRFSTREHGDNRQAPPLPCSLHPDSSPRISVPATLIEGGAWVRRHAIGREVKSWSKIYVPLIFSALEMVPPAAAATCSIGPRQRVSLSSDIARAQAYWQARFSRWNTWVAALQRMIAVDTTPTFVEQYVMTPRPKGKTALVFSDGAGFGWLPHVSGRNQERIMQIAAVDGEIATCISISCGPPPL